MLVIQPVAWSSWNDTGSRLLLTSSVKSSSKTRLSSSFLWLCTGFPMMEGMI